MCVVGTRPDAIKTAPVYLELKAYEHLVESVLVSTGQHREMLDQALGAFGIEADFSLNIMRHGQTLSEITERGLHGLDKLLGQLEPQFVIAQGDTTTTFVAGLAAFYRRIPFGHIEAGLRTDTIWDPFPEEFNRRAVSLVASQHYAPTKLAQKNLETEGISCGKIFITGNTGIDAVQYVGSNSTDTWFEDWPGRVILLTTHRRENWGEPQIRIAEAAAAILDRFEDVLLVVPMHRNPKVREVLEKILGCHPRVRMIEPPAYSAFVQLMKRATLILSDSGGVQEEAPAFGIPVLILRDTTERPEGIKSGNAVLVGTDKEQIVLQSTLLLSDKTAYEKMARAVSPYGDGRAALRIRYLALMHLGIESPEEAMWTS